MTVPTLSTERLEEIRALAAVLLGEPDDRRAWYSLEALLAGHTVFGKDLPFIAAASPQAVSSMASELLSLRSLLDMAEGATTTLRTETEAENLLRDMKEGRFPTRSDPQMVPDVPDAWDRIRDDPELASARRKLSMHELRLILKHARTALTAHS